MMFSQGRGKHLPVNWCPMPNWSTQLSSGGAPCWSFLISQGGKQHLEWRFESYGAHGERLLGEMFFLLFRLNGWSRLIRAVKVIPTVSICRYKFGFFKKDIQLACGWNIPAILGKEEKDWSRLMVAAVSTGGRKNRLNCRTFQAT